MSNSENLPHDFQSYAVLPRASHAGGILEDLLDHQAQALAEQGVDLGTVDRFESRVPPKTPSSNGSFDLEYPRHQPISKEIDIEIPEKAFLLRSPSGDIFLQPDGISEEEAFVVLFFDQLSSLYFRPSEGTDFVGAYNLESDQAVHDLFYSGIIFQLPDSERTAVIFHKR